MLSYSATFELILCCADFAMLVSLMCAAFCFVSLFIYLCCRLLSDFDFLCWTVLTAMQLSSLLFYAILFSVILFYSAATHDLCGL